MEYGFLSFVRNLPKRYGKQLLDIATKTGLDALKTAPRKVVHKAGEATGKFIGNKISDKIVKPNPLPAENSRNAEEIVISPEKRRNDKRVKKNVIKNGSHKISSKIIKRFNCIKFVAKKWIKVNDLSGGPYSVSKNIKFKTSILRLDLCDYSDAYIVVKAAVDLLAAAANEDDKAEKDVVFKSDRR